MKKNLQKIAGCAVTLVLSMTLFTACSNKSSQSKPGEIIEGARAAVNGPDGKQRRVATLAPGQPIIMADGEWVMIATTKYTGLPPADGKPSEIRLENGQIKTTNVKVEER